MPLYEYQCRRCGETFEVMQKFVDEPLKVHEGCGGEVERLLSAPALQFKGSGWYVTDYARGGKAGTANGGADSSKPESKKDSSSSETKSDSKPKSESKSETKSETKS